MAAGRPIVTTTKGMTGSLEHEEHVMVADTAEHFAKALVELLSNETKPPPWANADELGPKSCSTALRQSG